MMDFMSKVMRRFSKNPNVKTCSVFDIFDNSHFLSYLFFINTLLQKWDITDLELQDVVAKNMIVTIIKFMTYEGDEDSVEDFVISNVGKIMVYTNFNKLCKDIQAQNGKLEAFRNTDEGDLLNNLYSLYNPNCISTERWHIDG